MQEVADWLSSLPGVTGVSPATLTIGKQTWQGAVYTQFGRRWYYLVGELPKSTPKTCYRFNGDSRDWYVACYMQRFASLDEFQKRYHPFGNHWCLFAWDAPGKIDDYETPYRRQEVAA